MRRYIIGDREAKSKGWEPQSRHLDTLGVDLQETVKRGGEKDIE